MSAYHKKQKEKRRKNLFRKWHRRVGFTAALFLINLAVTGILLNHADALNLHKHFIKSDWLVNWYGIEAPNQVFCFETTEPEQPLCQLGEIRFLGNQLLESNTSELIGLTEYEELFYVASQDKISLYTHDWALVETLEPKDGLPSPVTSIGLLKLEQDSRNTDSNDTSNPNVMSSPESEQLTLVISSGQDYYLFAPDSITWSAVEVDLTKLIKSRPTGEYSLPPLQSEYLNNQISYLKLIQDLHSGRIINSAGKWITDIVGIIIILLAVSGFLAWQKRTKS